jgi:hypothetical protein
MSRRVPLLAAVAVLGVSVIALGALRRGEGDAAPPATTAATLRPAPATTAPLLDGEAPDTAATEDTIVVADELSAVEANRTPTTLPVEVAEEVPMDQLLIDDRTVGDVLPGMVRAPDELLGTGPLDLERAVAAEADREAERALLTTRGFEEGFSRGFVDDAGDTVIVQVYRFGDADGAAAYVVDGAEQLLGRGATPYDVTPLPGALGFSAADGDFEAHGVTFAVGRHHVLVVVGSPTGSRTSEEARLVALAQHDHLLTLVR